MGDAGPGLTGLAAAETIAAITTVFRRIAPGFLSSLTFDNDTALASHGCHSARCSDPSVATRSAVCHAFRRGNPRQSTRFGSATGLGPINGLVSILPPSALQAWNPSITDVVINKYVVSLILKGSGMKMISTPPNDEVLTAAEVAQLLRVSKATILRLHRAGRLQAIPIPGRALFLASTVTAFMHGSRQPDAELERPE